MKFFIIFIYSLLIISCKMEGQFTGKYTGTVNGDNITLELLQNQNKISGTMKDSKQTYIVEGTVYDKKVQATAKESTLGLLFILDGEIVGNNLKIKADIDIFGTKQAAFTTTLTKNGGTQESTSKSNKQNSSSNPNLPVTVKGKSIDPSLIGSWREESHYSSGYGSSFSGSTYNYMSFNADHTMSDLGSQATMSGSDFSGNSGGITAGKVIPGLWYYTEGNRIVAYIENNGSFTTADLGTYFIENGKLLFTQANTGKKILYHRI